MNVRALVLAGVGPVGRSVYLRDPHYARGDHGLAVARAIGARHVFVNGNRHDRKAIIAAHGGGWLYGLPEDWAPGRWRWTLDETLRRVGETGAAGFLADCENGWGRSQSSEAAELGRALAAAARETRVGVTSFPLVPILDALAGECRGWVWGSPQIYGQISTDGRPSTPDQWRAWHARWVRAFGPGSVVPSVAAGGGGLIRPQPFHLTEEGMRGYLGALPHGAGAIFWPGASIPRHVAAAVSSWEPGGSTLGTLAHAMRDAIVRPGGAVALSVVVALVVGLGVAGGMMA